MSKYHCLLFEEHVPRAFPGFEPLDRVYDLPIWGNHTIGNVARLSHASSMQHTIISVKNKEDLEHAVQFLTRGTDAQIIIVGRSGNLTVLDWNQFFHLKHPSDGIGKIHLGKDPSDMYMLPRKKLRDVMAELSDRVQKEGSRFCPLLFDDYLFRHFDRIVNLEGYSFLMRNCNEYWRENLNLNASLKNDRFLELYLQLQSPYEAKSSISEGGTVINSFLGCGSRVRGMVENSIIFHDVHIGKNASIRGSVILPYNSIDDGCVIENALILEGKDRIIERNSVIGAFEDVYNQEYPDLLKKGLSVVAQGVGIPRNSRIGAACLVAPGDDRKLSAPFVLESGASYRGD